MQISILLGFLFGFGALVLSALLENGFHFGGLLAFFNLPAMIIIFGGVAGATVVSFPVEFLREIPTALRKVFFDGNEPGMMTVAADLVDLSTQSRRDGILSLENNLADIADPWLRLGIQLVVDGFDREFLTSVFELRLEAFEEQTRRGARIFQAMGGYAPTLGIIGTVMGLVHMLANLQDASNVGGSIAIAFLATFWGILSANMIFLPIASRIRVKDNRIIGLRQAMIEGILSIQAGEPVRVLQERLRAFMSAEEQARFQEYLITREKGGA